MPQEILLNPYLPSFKIGFKKAPSLLFSRSVIFAPCLKAGLSIRIIVVNDSL